MTTLPRSTPEAQGLSSRTLTAFLDGAEAAGLELHSLMLLRHGHVVAEGWWAPYHPDGLQLLYSLSKSFTATAVGLAVHEGRFTLDDPVLGFFPDEAPQAPHPHLAAMRVSHLLSMASGHLADTLEPIYRKSAEDWLGGFFALPPEREPGSIFTYNNGATYVLSAIVQRVTGMGLLEYLGPRLLEPLGIMKARWDRNAQGLDFGFSGLHLATEAVARFGQLYLQRGRWEGQQLIPEAWVEEATREHIATNITTGEPSDEDKTDWEQGYGYQFWRCRHGAYRGDGAFGQFCVVMPEQDAVLVLTGATMTMQTVLDLAWAHLLPALNEQERALPEAPADHTALQQRLENLALPPVAGARSTPLAEQVLGQRYRFAAPAPQDPAAQLYALPELTTMSLNTTETGWLLELTGANMEETLECGYGQWLPTTSNFFATYPGPLRVSAAWTAADIFTMVVRYLETPHSLTLACHFGADGRTVRLEPRWNVQFGELELPELSGARV